MSKYVCLRSKPWMMKSSICQAKKIATIEMIDFFMMIASCLGSGRYRYTLRILQENLCKGKGLSFAMSEL